MYGRIHQRKLKIQDYELSCQMARLEMYDYIDQENRRVNVDSAKKKAVVQHMDYEGFRQMVLGANIFPTKSTQLLKLSQGNEAADSIMNSALDSFNFNNHKSNSKEVRQNKKELQDILNKKLNSELLCITFFQFKQKLDLYNSNQDEASRNFLIYKYLLVTSLIKHQKLQNLEKIFTCEFDAKYFKDIVNSFKYFIRNSIIENQQKKCFSVQKMPDLMYILKFLQKMQQINKLRVSLKLLTRRQRNEIKQLSKLLQSCKEYISKQKLEHFQIVQPLDKAIRFLNR